MENRINPRTKRIEYIDRIRTAYIMYKDIPIATISEESSTLTSEVDWVIKPIWENWDLCKSKYGVYMAIAGIDDTLHKDEYIRRYVPAFVTQRTIPDGREDLPEMMGRVGLKENDLFEMLCRTHGICGNDDLYVSRTPDKLVDVNSMLSDWIYDIPDFDTSEYGWLEKPIISDDCFSWMEGNS
jgi:hypothetical protein